MDNQPMRAATYSERIISISPSRMTYWPANFPIYPGKYRAIVEDEGCKLIRIGMVKVQAPETLGD